MGPPGQYGNAPPNIPNMGQQMPPGQYGNTSPNFGQVDTSSAQLQLLKRIQDEKTRQLQEEYGGKASRLFIEECKSSEFFRFNWGEMLGAAPTAISLLGQLWIAASHPVAYEINLARSRPQNGWQYLTNRNDLSLRSALIDRTYLNVCTLVADH